MELCVGKNEDRFVTQIKIAEALSTLVSHVVRFKDLEIGEKFLVLHKDGRAFPLPVYIKISEWNDRQGNDSALWINMGISNVVASNLSMVTSDQLVLKIS